MVEALTVYVQEQLVLVSYNGSVYEVMLQDLEQVNDSLCQVPIHALKPRDYYFEQIIQQQVQAALRDV